MKRQNFMRKPIIYLAIAVVTLTIIIGVYTPDSEEESVENRLYLEQGYLYVEESQDETRKLLLNEKIEFYGVTENEIFCVTEDAVILIDPLTMNAEEIFAAGDQDIQYVEPAGNNFFIVADETIYLYETQDARLTDLVIAEGLEHFFVISEQEIVWMVEDTTKEKILTHSNDEDEDDYYVTPMKSYRYDVLSGEVTDFDHESYFNDLGTASAAEIAALQGG